jgi:hypothetical protein
MNALLEMVSFFQARAANGKCCLDLGFIISKGSYLILTYTSFSFRLTK